MIKSYKIRLHPTPEQEAQMWQHIGACRWVWNYMVALQRQRHSDGEKHLSAFDMINLLKPLKNDGEHEWLYEISHGSLKVVCQDLALAYKELFKKSKGRPKFKSRKLSKPNFPLAQGLGHVYFKDGFATIPKIGKVKYTTNYTLPQGRASKFSNPRISFIGEKWILTLGVECENQAPTLSDNAMGIDVGVKELAVVAFGDEQIVFHNINKSKKVRGLVRKKKFLQRKVSRKYRTNKSFNKTKSILKYERMIAEIDYRIANIRRNYLHQTTHALVSMLPNRVVMEDLNVQGMMQNRHLSRAIQEQCLGEFFRQMEYKCEWMGIEVVRVGRFYPSSKTCSCCGTVKSDLKLSDRVYECPECGLSIDRDYNAAINLMRYANQKEGLAA